MKASWQDKVIAESEDTVVVEGNHYFPQSSVDSAYLRDSATTTVCPWKGTAEYYDVVVAGHVNKDAAWYYASPKDAAAQVTGHIAFWRGVEIAP